MNTGFLQLNAAINTLSNEVRGGSKTQWPIIIGFSSVTITILTGLGFLALQPIKDNIVQIREDRKVQTASTSTANATLVDKMVSKDEMQWRWDISNRSPAATYRRSLMRAPLSQERKTSGI